MRKRALGAMMAEGVKGQSGATHKGYEMPPHMLERQEGAREIRRYGSHVLAEVRVEGGREAAIRAGFSMLADYIFGANATGERIAMTVPVSQSPAGEGQGGSAVWAISFLMPGGLTTASLPAPRNKAIRLVGAGHAREVTERFSGRPETGDLAARAEALRVWAVGEGFEILDGPHFRFYDAPMTPPTVRRNEVAFTIR